MNVFVPECRYLHLGLKFSARLKQWSHAPAFPEDASAYLLEIAKFLTTGALILATGVLLLMLG
jgi:hypothetical protein